MTCTLMLSIPLPTRFIFSGFWIQSQQTSLSPTDRHTHTVSLLIIHVLWVVMYSAVFFSHQEHFIKHDKSFILSGYWIKRQQTKHSPTNTHTKNEIAHHTSLSLCFSFFTLEAKRVHSWYRCADPCPYQPRIHIDRPVQISMRQTNLHEPTT